MTLADSPELHVQVCCPKGKGLVKVYTRIGNQAWTVLRDGPYYVVDALTPIIPEALVTLQLIGLCCDDPKRHQHHSVHKAQHGASCLQRQLEDHTTDGSDGCD